MRHTVTAAILILALWSTTSIAQNKNDDSKIILTPYLWGTSLNGTSTVGTLPPLDIDASFGDILSNLNFAMSLHTEYHKGPWRFVLDPTYISLEADIPPPMPAPASATGATMDITIWLVEAWAGYAFTENWEVLGGVRNQDQDLQLSGLPNPPFPSSLGVSDDWSDWFAGLRYNGRPG